MNDRFLPSYYPVNSYNGERLHWTIRQFTADCQAFRIGPASLRQVRSTSGILSLFENLVAIALNSADQK